MSIHRADTGLATFGPENKSLNGFFSSRVATVADQSGGSSFKSLLPGTMTDGADDDVSPVGVNDAASGSKPHSDGGVSMEQRLYVALLSGYGVGASAEAVAADSESEARAELDASNPDLTAICRVDATYSDGTTVDNATAPTPPEMWNDFSYGGTNTPGGYLGEGVGSFAVDGNSGAIYFRKSDGAIGEKHMQPGDVVVDESGTTYAMASDGTVETMSFYY